MHASRTSDARIPRFRAESVTALPEPVRRYLAHAIDDGALLPARMHLQMRGRIHVGRWLDFEAQQTIGASGFVWQAKAGLAWFKPLQVADQYRACGGLSEGTLGPLRLFRARGGATDRAAAVRAALERIWCPAALLPASGVSWEAARDDRIVARVTVPPEEATVTLTLAGNGALSTASAPRWGRLGRHQQGYVPFGAFVDGEQRFGSFTLPSRVRAGWWFGSPGFTPFFEATILDAVPVYGEQPVLAVSGQQLNARVPRAGNP
jgi:uncharacterized protein DUF6544